MIKMVMDLKVGHVLAIGFSALSIAGCQVTSGHISSQAPKCVELADISDFRGSKPNWDIFAPVVKIQKCRETGAAQYRFEFLHGLAVSQKSHSDERSFYEINERSFRELLKTSKEFHNVADTIEIKTLSNNGRPTLYAIKSGYMRPYAFVVINEGYPGAVGRSWSQSHIAYFRASKKTSVADYEEEIVSKLRLFKPEGGDYGSAFDNKILKEKTNEQSSQFIKANTKSIEDKSKPNESAAKTTDTRSSKFIGSWGGVVDDFVGDLQFTSLVPFLIRE